MKFYRSRGDRFELIKGYLGVILMTVWGIIGINKTGVPFV